MPSSDDDARGAATVPNKSGQPRIGMVKLVNVGTELALDVSGQHKEDGVNIQQFRIMETDSELWFLDRRSDDRKSIRSVVSNKVVDVYQESTLDDANVVQWHFHGGTNQLWRLEQVDAQIFRIRNDNSGKLLTVNGSGEFASAIQREDDGSAEQHWRITEVAPTERRHYVLIHNETRLATAKAKWHGSVDYDKLGIGDSELIGVTADGNIIPVREDSGISTASAKGGVLVTKNAFGPGYKVMDSVAFMRASNPNPDPEVGVSTRSTSPSFEGHAEAEVQPLYAGAGVGFNLVGGSASIFDFNLGLGLSTGAGLKNDSVEVKVAGTGLTVGRKLGISVFDVSFGIDIVRTANAVWYVGKELAVAVAIVPAAMETAGSDLLGELKAMPGAFANAGTDLKNEVVSMPGEFADAGSDLVTEVAKIPAAFAEIPGAFVDGFGDLF